MKAKMRSSTKETSFKIIIVGDSGTGKSCLLTRYIKNQFLQEYKVTIGADFESKVIPIDDNYSVKLQIWDTAGQESFRSIVTSFYKKSSAVILVYNMTCLKSFENLSVWLKQARENSAEYLMIIIVGTHMDLVNKKEVTKDMVDKFMTENHIGMSFDTSAKENLNISKVFEELAKQLFVGLLTKRRFTGTIAKGKPLQKLQTHEKQQSNKRKCCF